MAIKEIILYDFLHFFTSSSISDQLSNVRHLKDEEAKFTIFYDKTLTLAYE